MRFYIDTILAPECGGRTLVFGTRGYKFDSCRGYLAYYNVWLSLKRARIIAHDLEEQFLGSVSHEDLILEAMWTHPLYEDQMWLDVDWNDEDEVVEIHVGIEVGIII